jgi:hypothetical protein
MQVCVCVTPQHAPVPPCALRRLQCLPVLSCASFLYILALFVCLYPFVCPRNLTGAWCGDRFKAVDDHVRSGMVVGLGTGSTAFFAVQRVGQKLRTGELSDIICIPTVR